MWFLLTIFCCLCLWIKFDFISNFYLQLMVSVVIFKRFNKT